MVQLVLEDVSVVFLLVAKNLVVDFCGPKVIGITGNFETKEYVRVQRRKITFSCLVHMSFP